MITSLDSLLKCCWECNFLQCRGIAAFDTKGVLLFVYLYSTFCLLSKIWLIDFLLGTEISIMYGCWFITLHIVEIFVSKVPNFLVEFMWYDLWILHCVMIMIYVPCWFNLFSNMLIEIQNHSFIAICSPQCSSFSYTLFEYVPCQSELANFQCNMLLDFLSWVWVIWTGLVIQIWFSFRKSEKELFWSYWDLISFIRSGSWIIIKYYVEMCRIWL